MRTAIRTPRLTLRAPRAGDAAAIAPLADDRGVARMLATMPHPYSPEAAGAWVAQAREGWRTQTGHDYVIEAEEGIVGAAGVRPQPGSGLHELGFWLGRPFWGRGYAREAARAVVDAFFEDSGETALACECFADNAASERVIRALGFTRTGLRERWCEARGREAPCLGFRLTRQAWARRRMAAS